MSIIGDDDLVVKKPQQEGLDAKTIFFSLFQNKDYKLSLPEIYFIFREYIAKRSAKTPLGIIRLNKDQKLVVIGDTHGYPEMAINIIKINGFPSDNLLYLFNGDMVDRGPQSTNNLIMILALALTFPDKVYINRGNHEDFSQNLLRLLSEIPNDDSGEVYINLLNDTYVTFHYACLVNDVFITHGGIRAKFSLLDIEKAVTLPYLLRDGLMSGMTGYLDPTNTVLQILTWGRLREGNVRFTEMDIDQFITNNNLKYIIRSHGPLTKEDDGCHWTIPNKLLTIISVPKLHLNKTAGFGLLSSDGSIQLNILNELVK
jgi:serine/threonine-protein phosphatase 5